MQTPLPGFQWNKEFDAWTGRFELEAWKDVGIPDGPTLGELLDSDDPTPEQAAELEGLNRQMQKGLEQMTALLGNALPELLTKGFETYKQQARLHPDAMPQVETLEEYRRLMHIDKVESLLRGEEVDFSEFDEEEEEDAEDREGNDGRIEVWIGNEGESSRPTGATPAQAAAWEYTLRHQEAIRRSIFAALLPWYQKRRQAQWEFARECDRQSGETGRYSMTGMLDEEMPPVESPERFRELLEIMSIHLLRDEKDGMSYVGYEMGCDWEAEHGLGVVVYKEQVVDIGFADIAFGGFEIDGYLNEK